MDGSLANMASIEAADKGACFLENFEVRFLEGRGGRSGGFCRAGIVEVTARVLFEPGIWTCTLQHAAKTLSMLILYNNNKYTQAVFNAQYRKKHFTYQSRVCEYQLHLRNSTVRQVCWKQQSNMSKVFLKENVGYPVWTCRDPMKISSDSRDLI